MKKIVFTLLCVLVLAVQVGATRQHDINVPIVAKGSIANASATLVLTDGAATASFNNAAIFASHSLANYDMLEVSDTSKRKVYGFIKTLAGTTVTITNTPGGTTQNWAVKDAAFDNDTNVTYRIISPTPYGKLILGQAVDPSAFHLATKDGEAMLYHDSIDLSSYGTSLNAPYLITLFDAAGKMALGYIGYAGGGKSLDTEIATGTLVSGRLYEITATEANHFGIDYVVGRAFTSNGTETCDANNKVKAFLNVAATGVKITNVWKQVLPLLGRETAVDLVVFNNKLYSTVSPTGKLFEWNGTDSWVEVAPQLNAQTYANSLVVFNNKLYGGTYPGGKLFEWNGTDSWVEVADMLNAQTQVRQLAVFNNKLYAGMSPNGKLFEWNGTDSWVEVAPQLNSQTSVYGLAVFNSKLYGGTHPHGKLFEWNGTNAWVEVAPQLNAQTRIYGLVVFNNKLYGGTYPGGKLFEWNGINAWVEVADMLNAQSYAYSPVVFNNKLYAGMSPNGKLFEWNGTNSWIEVAPQSNSQTGAARLTVFNNKLYGGGKALEYDGVNYKLQSVDTGFNPNTITSVKIYRTF